MKNYLAGALLLCFCWALAQQDTQFSVDEMNKKRQNPVEGLRSIYFQGVLLPDVGNGTAQSYSIQPVYPFKLTDDIKLITYTIIPVQHQPKLSVESESATGLGNILFNGYFSPMKKKGNVVWGAGPAVQIPTRTEPELGSNTLSMGPSALLYFVGEKISGGAVVQNYWSLGGSGVNKVNLFSCQYFGYYNFNQGWFLLSNTTLEANWLADNEKWLIPLGGGAGKTFKMGKLFYCGTAQLFYNAAKPEPIGNWEIIFQLQMIL